MNSRRRFMALAIGAAAFSPIVAVSQQLDQIGGTTTFVRIAGHSSLYEIEAGRIALARSRNQGVRGFAEQTIRAHDLAYGNLKGVNNSNAGASLPQTPDSERQRALEELRVSSDPSFDVVYIEQQIRNHETTLSAYRSYSTVGEVESLRKFAAETLPILERDLREARTISGGLPR
jgi:putative membrane protein